MKWERIKDVLPIRPETVGLGQPSFRQRRVVVVCRWRGLPERYGKYKSLHMRFSRWTASGVWEKKIFQRLLRYWKLYGVSTYKRCKVVWILLQLRGGDRYELSEAQWHRIKDLLLGRGTCRADGSG